MKMEMFLLSFIQKELSFIFILTLLSNVHSSLIHEELGSSGEHCCVGVGRGESKCSLWH